MVSSCGGTDTGTSASPKSYPVFPSYSECCERMLHEKPPAEVGSLTPTFCFCPNYFVLLQILHEKDY